MLITVMYIRLRTRRSEELTLTYVPMQQNRFKPMKRHNADKNAEYMDMRRVQQLAGTIRDVNHNSHSNGSMCGLYCAIQKPPTLPAEQMLSMF
ncbi:uncharacterized protein si:ch211-67e16.3 isoform X2 [Trichomycterus rosablanca]|uniref:uncharacterized protein si:ch211-67e16.3 isoform X2 n=1 Tax=Trichomycterus rosablanca TaxID=2290929 RepID=UPI002F35095D